MRKIYLFPLLITFISCHTPGKELTNEQHNQLEKSADSISINFTQQNDASKITKQVDTAIHLIITNDTAYYKKGEILLVKSYIRPKTIISGDSSNPKEIQDDAFIIANCLIVLKNIKTAGHFCHTPEVARVEIYTQNGSNSIIKRGVSKSKSLQGFDFISNFFGNRFNSPSGNWGLINIEAEGQLYGYLIIKSDGTIKEINIEEKLYLTGETFKADFNEMNELVWTGMSMDNIPIDFVVNAEGDYRIDKK